MSDQAIFTHRMPRDLLERLDEWRESQPVRPSRARTINAALETFLDMQKSDQMTIAKRLVEEAGNLVRLLGVLEGIRETMAPCDWKRFWDANSADFPNYGGETPADTTDVWSWDETRLLVSDEYAWMMIVNRP
jgi:hypothetical protein